MSENDKTVITQSWNDDDVERKNIYLANRQAQKELESGEASSQIVTHFLKLGTQRYEVELKRLELETKLLESKIENESLAREKETSIQKVLDALSGYRMPNYNDDLDVDFFEGSHA